MGIPGLRHSVMIRYAGDALASPDLVSRGKALPLHRRRAPEPAEDHSTRAGTIASKPTFRLTVSEIFPLELRALAIAFFYAIGTGVGGIVGPLTFGMLIDIGSRTRVAIGYFIDSILMLAAAAAEALWGVAAERKPLEAVSRPLALVN
jgi:hypothetical protein